MPANWPDELTKPTRSDVASMLADFWSTLAGLPDLLERGEILLCAELAGNLRETVLGMMLALNGIAHPHSTRHLNTYLSASQRQALEKTLLLPDAGRDGWIGQFVALIVIYRWYAPQLVSEYAAPYPSDGEQATLGLLSQKLPDWPRTITTD